MTDCYRILGIPRHATSLEIRAAYLARIKLCHPDAAGDNGGREAGEISHAYWQLRDASRRAAHDLDLIDRARPAKRTSGGHGGTPPARKLPTAGSSAKNLKTARSRSSRRRSTGRRLQPLRAVAGVVACALAVVGFAAAGTHFGSQGAPAARASIPDAAGQLTSPVRRQTDPALSAAAAEEFSQIVKRSGTAGAHLYARQCLIELKTRPTLAMLDYCLTFDEEGSSWEAASHARRGSQRYFAAAQKFGRYRSAAQGMAPGGVREAMLAEVSNLAQQED